MPNKDKLPWSLAVRRASGLVELICKHGVGHPAPASVHWMELHGREKIGMHGCCGCCSTPEWKLAAATQGYQIANKLLKDAQHKFKCAAHTIDELHAKIHQLEGHLASAHTGWGVFANRKPPGGGHPYIMVLPTREAARAVAPKDTTVRRVYVVPKAPK